MSADGRARWWRGAGASYLIAISVAAAFRRDRPVAPGKRESRFAMLIPAHDEELLLAPALASVQAQDHPADHYEAFVVADNCSGPAERGDHATPAA